LGAGDVARTRERRALVDQAAYALADVQARVGAEVTAAARSALYRYRALPSSQEAIRQALETWRRLQKASFGMAGAKREYDPLEPSPGGDGVRPARHDHPNGGDWVHPGPVPPLLGNGPAAVVCVAGSPAPAGASARRARALQKGGILAPAAGRREINRPRV